MSGTQQSLEYYDLDVAPVVMEDDSISFSSAVGAGFLAGFNSAIVDTILPYATVKQPATFTLQLAVLAFKGGVANALQQVELAPFTVSTDGNGNFSIDGGSTWQSIANNSGNLGKILLNAALLSGVAAGITVSGSEVLGAALIGGAVDATYTVLQSLVNGYITAAVNAFTGLTPVDAQFFDSDGNQTEGVYLPDGIGSITLKAVIEYFISQTSTDLSGGYISFAASTVQGYLTYGQQYNIQDASLFGTISSLLDIDLSTFLATGPSADQKNIYNYATNAVGAPYVYGISGQDANFFIPVTIGGQAQTIDVNNIFSVAADGSATLSIGDGDHLLGNEVELFVPDSSSATTITGRVNHFNLIIGNNAGDTITGGNDGDIIVGGTGNDVIYGGDGSDTVSDGSGNDIFYPGDGTYTINLGTGNDTIANAGLAQPQAINVTMSQGESLSIAAPSRFVGTILNFTSGNTLDLDGIGMATSAALSANNVLTVQAIGIAGLTLDLDPTQNFNSTSFLLAPDGAGGTDIIAESDVQPIAFTGTSEVLLVVNPGSLTGTVSAFIPGDTIDLAGIGTATGAVFDTSGALTVQETGGGSLTLYLDPNQSYAGDNFVVTPDNNGGTDITINANQGAGKSVVFAGEDSQGEFEVWTTDGTAGGTRELTTISGGFPQVLLTGDPGVSTLFSLGSKAVFDAYSDGQLWVTDGTTAGTQQLTQVTNAKGGIAPGTFVALGNAALFTGYDANGYEQLWITDGTQSGTKQLTSVTTGTSPGSIMVLGSLAFFVGLDANGNSQLWVTNGTPAGTEELTNIAGGVNPSDITAYGNKILFSGVNTNGVPALWVSNGTPGGTQVLTTTPDREPSDITVAGSNAFFVGVDNNFDINLWMTNGTPGGTEELLPLSNTLGGYSHDELLPSGLTAIGSSVVFSGWDANSNYQLLVSNGTAAGTQLVATGPGGSALSPSDFETFGNQVLFQCYISGIRELAVTSGTFAGTALLTTAGVGVPTSIFPGYTMLANKMLYVGVDSAGQDRLWATNGTPAGTVELSSSLNAYAVLDSTYSVVLNGKILLSGTDAQGNDQLWVTDGTPSGTMELTNITNAATVLDPQNFVVVGNKAFFEGVDANGNEGLWITDGTVSGTQEVATDYSDLSPFLGVSAVLSASALCFCAGTLIATAAGEKLVERLVVGDKVLTQLGEVRRVVWIGAGRVLATRGRRNAATPVIMRKGALADNVPYHDLRVTKGHSFYVDGVLIPVEFLVNHRSILWDDRAQEVTVYHIELETHDVLLANGAPAESYRDDGNRWLFQNGNTGWNLPPKPPFVPVMTGGPIVDAAWRRLLERYGPHRGPPLTDDPDLHLLADGIRLDAAERSGAVYVFNLASAPAALRIVSRAAAPQELGLARDPRSLGVALRGIIVRQGTRFKVTGADDARLAEGFHAFEADNGLRWTDGDAAVPEALFAGFCDPTELVLHLGGTTQYIADSAALRAA